MNNGAKRDPSLTQEEDDLKEILNDWDEIAKFDLDVLVSCDIL